MGSGFRSSTFNPAGRLLGSSYQYLDPLVAKTEKLEEGFTKRNTILGAASPTAPDAQFASPNDPTRRRVGNASGELSTMLGGQ